jgi:hypothetical protein
MRSWLRFSMRRCKALKERLWGGEVGKKCTI